MQESSLLVQLNLFFYPNTMVVPLGNSSSDHIPLVVVIGTNISKARLFRFENFWVEKSDFYEVVKNSWNSPSNF